LDLIKEPSNELFSFSEAVLGMHNDHEIHADAEFLFTHLSKLDIKIVPDYDAYPGWSGNDAWKFIERFIHITKSGQLEFIGLELNFKNGEFDWCLPRLLGSCCQRLDALTLNMIDMSTRYSLRLMFSDKDGLPVEWPKLTKLRLIKCKFLCLDPLIFDLFPNLRELELEQNYITHFDADVFRKASSLLEFKLSGSKPYLDRCLRSAKDCF
jgi:hypothetical protein